MTDVYHASLLGKRPSNEDKVTIIKNIDGSDKEIAPIDMFCIYDGHGGNFVSTFLYTQYPILFKNKKVQYPLNQKYVLNVYDKLDKFLVKKYAVKAAHTGSTCLALFHFIKDNKKYINILNTGDSRAITLELIGDLYFAKQLTLDHKPNAYNEKRRIEKLGGKIYLDGQEWRILDLSVSRSFGDVDSCPFVINTPDFFKFKINPDNKFIILACDGLYDVMSNQEAVDFVLNECYDEKLEKRINKNVDVAKKLGEYAIKKGSNDNVSIIIVFFD